MNNEGVISLINTEIEEGLKSPNGFETKKGEVDKELIRFGKFGLVDLDKTNTRARENFKEADLQHTYLACKQQQQSTRFSKPTQNKHVLPQWTRIYRSNHGRVVQNEKITGKKRNIVESEDHSGLPSKRERASQNDDTGLFRLVEAEIQLCQQ